MALSYSGFLGFHFNCTGLNMIRDSSLVPFDLAQEKIKALVFLFFIGQLFPMIKLLISA